MFPSPMIAEKYAADEHPIYRHLIVKEYPLHHLLMTKEHWCRRSSSYKQRIVKQWVRSRHNKFSKKPHNEETTRVCLPEELTDALYCSDCIKRKTWTLEHKHHVACESCLIMFSDERHVTEQLHTGGFKILATSKQSEQEVVLRLVVMAGAPLAVIMLLTKADALGLCNDGRGHSALWYATAFRMNAIAHHLTKNAPEDERPCHIVADGNQLVSTESKFDDVLDITVVCDTIIQCVVRGNIPALLSAWERKEFDLFEKPYCTGVQWLFHNVAVVDGIRVVSEDVINFLVNVCGLQPSLPCSYSGISVLQQAIMRKDDAATKYWATVILQDGPVDTYIGSHSYTTAMIVGNLSAFAMLIELTVTLKPERVFNGVLDTAYHALIAAVKLTALPYAELLVQYLATLDGCNFSFCSILSTHRSLKGHRTSPVHQACFMGNMHILDMMHANSPCDYTRWGRHSDTPLASAIRGGQKYDTLAVIQWLCEYFHSRNIMIENSCISLAVEMCPHHGNDTDILQYLIEVYDTRQMQYIHRRNSAIEYLALHLDAETPLLLAVRFGYVKVAQLLLKNGANLQAVEARGNNILHGIARMEATPQAKEFLEWILLFPPSQRPCIEPQDNKWMTPFAVAIHAKNLAMVQRFYDQHIKEGSEKDCRQLVLDTRYKGILDRLLFLEDVIGLQTLSILIWMWQVYPELLDLRTHYKVIYDYSADDEALFRVKVEYYKFLDIRHSCARCPSYPFGLEWLTPPDKMTSSNYTAMMESVDLAADYRNSRLTLLMAYLYTTISGLVMSYV
jgi:hypothetical protein